MLQTNVGEDHTTLSRSSSRVEETKDAMTTAGPPVFMIGIMARTGTNYFADILQLIDPTFHLPRVLYEDFLLEHSNLLGACVDRTYQRWKRMPSMKEPEKWKQHLTHRFGEALLKLLRDGLEPDQRLLAKTPGATNVERFYDLFPNAKLILLIRDGRDVVESAKATWPYESYEFWIRQWAGGVRSMQRLMSGPGKGLRGSAWEIVKYEDLLNTPEQVVGPLAKFLGVEDRFDWRKFKDLPIRGSSQNRDSKGKVDWNPTKEIAGFKPVGRWAKWSWSQKRQFNRLAGSEMAAIGYDLSSKW